MISGEGYYDFLEAEYFLLSVGFTQNNSSYLHDNGGTFHGQSVLGNNGSFL